jgi:membrane protease subunit (stomatin/prohibitin family)
MAIIEGIKRQFRSVIEWKDLGSDELLMQWTENGDEIKNASKLIIGPGQGCIFVYQGQVKSIIEQPCLINLETDNIPFWTTIKKFMQFFESEHKVGIYFYKKTKILDQKWGTTSLIKYQDPLYHFPVGLKAYGNYSYQIADAEAFFVNIVGSHNGMRINEFRDIIAGRIINPISDYLAECGYSFAEIDANREEIARGISIKLAIVFRKLGFDISDFRIEGTDFDEDTLRRINRIADLTAEAQASQAVGLNYAAVQQLEAAREAARNESGGAGMGMGLGAGIGLGQNLAQSMGSISSSGGEDSSQIAGKLTELKKLFDSQLITEAEYATKKQQILDKF